MTVQQVFDMAIHLMDEQNESTGQTQTVDTDEYRYRTISILNSVIPVLFPYSEGSQPYPVFLTAQDYKNPDFTQEILLDDTLSHALLPFYLAAQLLSGENEDLAAWFINQYNATFREVRNHAPAEFKPIPNPYGLF